MTVHTLSAAPEIVSAAYPANTRSGFDLAQTDRGLVLDELPYGWSLRRTNKGSWQLFSCQGMLEDYGSRPDFPGAVGRAWRYVLAECDQLLEELTGERHAVRLVTDQHLACLAFPYRARSGVRWLVRMPTGLLVSCASLDDARNAAEGFSLGARLTDPNELAHVAGEVTR